MTLDQQRGLGASIHAVVAAASVLLGLPLWFVVANGAAGIWWIRDAISTCMNNESR